MPVSLLCRMDSDAVMPDEHGFAKLFNSIQEEINESEPELRQDEMMAQFSATNYWLTLFRPMLESRIEAYKHLLEVKFDGTESMAEIGIRFTLSSLVAQELENIINTVELTTQVVSAKHDKSKPKTA